MRAIEIGQRLEKLGQQQEAARAYALALEKEELQPIEKMEAAVYLLENGGDYKSAYDAFLSLYQAGEYRDETFQILAEAFYGPNVQDLMDCYGKNVTALQQYLWLFRKDFPAFEDLPLLFFPYDDDTFVPFDARSGVFLPKFSPRREEITHYFFRDLDKPVLAEDIFSQYELEYLNDNVRRSEDVGRENHIYLYYKSWEVFCAYLQAVDLRELLETEKAVFLFGDEINQYPIDFKERFGIDYSQYPLRPVRLREIKRMIWHTQLSTHNGGDFFNEIFDFHPNLLFRESVFLTDAEEEVKLVRDALRAARSLKDAQEQLFDHWSNPGLVEELYYMETPSDKDLLAAFYLGESSMVGNLDTASRIVPAVFFQPHFPNMIYSLEVDQQGNAVLLSDEVDHIRSSSLFAGFKYIKTFTPIRRFTSSYGGSMRFYDLFSPNEVLKEKKKSKKKNMEEGSAAKESASENSSLSSPPGGFPSPDAVNEGDELEGKDSAYTLTVVEDILGERVRNRSFMTDPEDRLFRDSVLVRLEDGKLNPEATLTRLAAFLDLPYTETMTYCSDSGRRDPIPWTEQGKDHYAIGFNLNSVYKTYDDYVNPYEKRYIEYLLRDAYAYFGYDFQVYDGSAVDDTVMEEWISHFDTMDAILRRVQRHFFDIYKEISGKTNFDSEEIRKSLLDMFLNGIHESDRQSAKALMAGIRFVNRNGAPLRMGRLLEPDPALLAAPLYH